MKLINAKIVGLRRFTSQKTNKTYTTAYLEYEDKDTKGTATASCFLPDDMIGEIGAEVEGAFANGRFNLIEY